MPEGCKRSGGSVKFKGAGVRSEGGGEDWLREGKGGGPTEAAVAVEEGRGRVSETSRADPE